MTDRDWTIPPRRARLVPTESPALHLQVLGPAPSRTDRIAALRQEMRELGAGMLEDALSSAEALVQKLRELAEAPSDAVSDGQRDAAGKLAADLDSRVTTMRQIQARAS